MKEELDGLIKAIVAVKPHVESLVEARAKLDSANKELASVTAQLERLRATVKEERDARSREVHDEKKRHDDLVVARQSEVDFTQYDIDRAKAELTAVHNDIAKWSAKLEELAAKTNRLEKSLA